MKSGEPTGEFLGFQTSKLMSKERRKVEIQQPSEDQTKTEDSNK